MNLKKKLGQIKAVSDEGFVTAVIATLNVIDKDGDVTLPGAFGEQEAVVLPTHDWGHIPIGRAKISEKDGVVVAQIKFNLDVAAGLEWYKALKFDFDSGKPLQEYSYGFTIEAGGQATGEFNGRSVRFLKPQDTGAPGLKVHEVSPVLVGAGMGTRTVAVKDAFASHGTEVVDRAWDGAAAIKNAKEGQDRAYYGRIFAWYDPAGDQGAKSSYKFPHHEVSADGTPGAANKQALIAGIAALNGGRGGADIPEGDRAGVYAHLKKHLADAGIDAPELRAAEQPKGVTFSDEADAALVAVKAFKDRALALADLRAKSGRAISPANVAKLKSLKTELGAVLTAIGTIVEASDAALKEFARFQRTLAGNHTQEGKRK